MHRGIGRADIFHHDRDRVVFVGLLGELDERFGLEVHAYVLMGNHYHLLVRSAEGQLSRAMRHLNGVYTQRHNWHHDRDGALLAGRYHSSLIEADSYLTRVARYIHLNPVTAGLVPAPERHWWSSYPGYLNPSEAPEWLHRDRVLGYFGGSRSALHRSTVAGDADSALDILERSAPPAVLGSPTFVADALAAADDGPETSAARRQAAVRPTLWQIDEVVAAAFGVDCASLLAGRRGQPNTARMVAVFVAAERSGRSHIDIAEHYGYRGTKGVSSALTRVADRCRDDPRLLQRLDDVGGRLVQG